MIKNNCLSFGTGVVGGTAALDSSSINEFLTSDGWGQQTFMAVAGYFDNLLAVTNISITTPDTIVQLWLNGVATDLVADITTSSNGTIDEEHTVYVNQGDVVWYTLTSTGDAGEICLAVRFTET
jgi:hypothetical protein